MTIEQLNYINDSLTHLHPMEKSAREVLQVELFKMIRDSQKINDSDKKLITGIITSVIETERGTK